VERLYLRLPMVGGIAASAAQAKFARSFAALFGAGLGVLTALRLAAESSGSGVLEQRVSAAIPSIENGSGVSAALAESRAISQDMLNMLSVAETAGDIDNLMVFVAQSCEQETQTRLHKLAVFLGSIAILIVGIVVGMIVISFWARGTLH